MTTCEKCNMNYKPKFSPEIYLKFLNSMPRFSIEFSIREGSYWLHSSDETFYFEGGSIEECLDQAILETGFDKTSEEK